MPKPRKNRNLKTNYRAILDLIKDAGERTTIKGRIHMMLSAASMIGFYDDKLTGDQKDRLLTRLHALID